MSKKVKKENAQSLINIILVIFIVVCVIAILHLLKDNDIQNVADTNNQEYNVVTIEDGKIDRPSVANLTNSINTTQADNIVKLNITTNSSETYEVDKYYYKQLNSYSKSMYTTIVKNISTLKSGYGTIKFDLTEPGIENNFQTAWDAMCMDMPEIFYLNTRNVTLQTSTTSNLLGNTKYQYSLITQEGKSYLLDTWNNGTEVQNAIDNVESIANSIVSSATGTTYNKVKYVHDYIINNVSYNQTENTNNSNIYGALINKRAVCEGYADTLKYLLDKLNIPCVAIYGNGIGDNGETEFHAWNYVMMDDGKWYAIDATWDDPIIIGNGTLSEETKHKYFLKGSNEFFSTHKEDHDVSGTGQNFQYPELSTNNYN